MNEQRKKEVTEHIGRIIDAREEINIRRVIEDSDWESPTPPAALRERCARMADRFYAADPDGNTIPGDVPFNEIAELFRAVATESPTPPASMVERLTTLRDHYREYEPKTADGLDMALRVVTPPEALREALGELLKSVAELRTIAENDLDARSLQLRKHAKGRIAALDVVRLLIEGLPKHVATYATPEPGSEALEIQKSERFAEGQSKAQATGVLRSIGHFNEKMRARLCYRTARLLDAEAARLAAAETVSTGEGLNLRLQEGEG